MRRRTDPPSSTCCASIARPSMPLRMSVRPHASQTRAPDGRPIIRAAPPAHGARRADRSRRPHAPPCRRRRQSRSGPAGADGGDIGRCQRLGRHLDAGKSPDRITRLRRFQRLSPRIELPGADAVLARNVGWRCARRQALCRNRLLLLGRPATAPFAAWESNPSAASERSYDWSYGRSLLMPPSRSGLGPCPWRETSILNAGNAMWASGYAYGGGRAIRRFCSSDPVELSASAFQSTGFWWASSETSPA